MKEQQFLDLAKLTVTRKTSIIEKFATLANDIERISLSAKLELEDIAVSVSLDLDIYTQPNGNCGTIVDVCSHGLKFSEFTESHAAFFDDLDDFVFSDIEDTLVESIQIEKEYEAVENKYNVKLWESRYDVMTSRESE